MELFKRENNICADKFGMSEGWVTLIVVAADAIEQAKKEDEEDLSLSFMQVKVGEKASLGDLLSMEVIDMNEKPVKLGDVFTKDIMAVALLRHFG